MIQIPANQLFDGKAAFQDFLSHYFIEATYEPAISEATQQATLERLNTDTDREQFYWVVDISEERITHRGGITRWLGYGENNFLLKDATTILHPQHAVVQACFGQALCHLLLRQPGNWKFMQLLCTTTLALKQASGHYLYCKRQCLPFQLGVGGNITEYLCCFGIVKNYAQEEYHTRLGQALPHHRQLTLLLAEEVKAQLPASKKFSTQEMRILKRYATAADATSEKIASAFRIKKSTVNTYNKRIINKTEDLFRQRFDDARKAAAYLKRMGLI